MKIRSLPFVCAILTGLFTAGSVFAQADRETAPPTPVSEDQMTEQETKLIEQMADLDPSAPDYQAKLNAIGAELRQLQGQMRTIQRAPFNTQPSARQTSAVPEPENAISPFEGMDNATLRQLRNELNSQLKYLNQTLETLGPQDEALSDSLKEQQTELTARLKELDTRLGAPETAEPAQEDPSAAFPGLTANQPELPQTDPAPFGAAVSASLDPTRTEGTWYGGGNADQKILDAVAELKKADEAIQKQLLDVLDELKTIETQLKLLSRQAVESGK